MKNKLFILFEIIIPLFLAAIIYLLFRPNETLVFQIFEVLNLDVLVLNCRVLVRGVELPNWFVFSLPGGLWLLSFQNAISYLNGWQKKTTFLLILFASLFGIGLEVLQWFEITDGRFDFIDIAFYFGATLLSLFNYYLIINKWELYVPEKKSPNLVKGVFFMFIVIIYLADIV